MPDRSVEPISAEPAADPAPSPAALIELRPQGLYCPAGDFYIDAWQPVPCNVVTHAHADHARPQMGEYHCATPCAPLLQWRLAESNLHAHDYGTAFDMGPVQVSLHPAGHILGSAQVRIEHQGEVWVFTGDFKRQPDPTCVPFELLACDTLITEATFAFPVYRWPPMREVVLQIEGWLRDCAARGETAVLYAYSLGKAQRLLAELAHVLTAPAIVHGALQRPIELYRAAGVALADTESVADYPTGHDFAGRLVLAPPSAAGSSWLRRFKHAQQAFASGWMQLRGNRRRRNYDRGFVISDHADWPALLRTIEETGARRVFATHGNSDTLVQLLRERGLDAQALHTQYGDEEDDAAAPAVEF
ncbi:MAG: ligase-associated DNA damage response exonuclease [Burkholderiaceae bacterium]